MIKKLKNSVNLALEMSLFLIFGVFAAILWQNLWPESYGEYVHSSHFLVNDIFMVFFFGIAVKEIKESFLPGGDLENPKTAINPIIGTIGGVAMPIIVFFAVLYITDQMQLSRGFGIPTATDIAIAWMIARIIFGKSHPAVRFLLLLAIIDDAIGLGIIAIFYPDPNNPVQVQYLLVVLVGMLVSLIMNKYQVKNFWYYIIIGGGLSWFGLHEAHLHTALALVPIVPFIPSGKKDEGIFAEEERREEGIIRKKIDPLNKFEHFFKNPIEVGLFFFALTNAGVMLSSVGAATWPIMLGLCLGKILGIFGFSVIAKLAGLQLPKGMNTKDLFIVSMIAGIGLTVALFVAGVAYTDVALQASSKMGVLIGSGSMVVLSLITAKIIGIKPIKDTGKRTIN